MKRGWELRGNDHPACLRAMPRAAAVGERPDVDRVRQGKGRTNCSPMVELGTTRRAPRRSAGKVCSPALRLIPVTCGASRRAFPGITLAQTTVSRRTPWNNWRLRAAGSWRNVRGELPRVFGRRRR